MLHNLDEDIKKLKLRCVPEIVVDDCDLYGPNEFRPVKLTMEQIRKEVAFQLDNQRKLYLSRRKLRLINKKPEASNKGRPDGQLFRRGEDPTLISYLGQRTAVLAAFNSGSNAALCTIILPKLFCC
jgi:hypothetical protein